MRPFLIAIALLLTLAGTSQAAESTQAPSGAVDYVLDPEGVLSLEKIQKNPRALEWKTARRNGDLPHWWTKPLWFRVRFKNESHAEKSWIFIFEWNCFRNVEFYYPRPDGSVAKGVSGNAASASQRTIALRTPAFPVELPQGENRVLYIRAIPQGQLLGTWFLIPAANLASYRLRDEGPMLLSFGFMLAVLLSSMMFFYSTRDRALTYYIVAECMIWIHQLIMTGMADLHASIPGFVWQDWFTFFLCFLLAMSLQLGATLLESKRHSPHLYQVIRALTVVCVALGLLTRSHPTPMLGGWIEAAFFSQALVLLAATLIAIKKGYRPARYYLISWFLYMMPSIAFILWHLGLLDVRSVPSEWTVFAFATEALLLSFTLASRVQLLKKNLMATIEKSRQDLEQKVEERTAELKKANAEMEKQRAAMIPNARLSAVGSMAAGIAHEINNPLAIILSQIALFERNLQNESPDPIQTRTFLSRMERAVERISRITHGLLAFTRGSSDGPLKAVVVNKLVQDTLELCGSDLENRGIQLRIDKDELLCRVNCRESQISQILVHLLSNSRDALAELKEKWIRISAVEEEDRVKIRIEDSGPGIPEEIRYKILEPFFTTKAVGKGTGLGLSVSKGIAEGQGGTLELDSSGPHTRFVLTLARA